MFDPATSALITSAPAFDGLNLESLPKRLTEAYADVVAARIRLRGQSRDEAPPETVASTLNELRRLAVANEVYAALMPDRENRAAAAFVAASSHQALAIGTRRARGQSRVEVSTVSAEVSAALLFLIAEAHADAAEVAKRISGAEDVSPAEVSLLNAIRHLAQGRLGDIVGAVVPESSVSGDLDDRALEALHLLLLKGVLALARRLRSRIDGSGAGAATSLFTRVKELSVARIAGVLEGTEPVYSIYSGPLHLANLLLAVERDLVATALTRIPTPSQVGELDWLKILRRMARTRPYLWRNHRQAITEGYLERGVSSAISFPTGAGKSTLAELKIATSLLHGEKVIFMAPTHALVGQTARALQNTFQNYEVLGDVDDESSITDVVVLPEVIVTTPERCLMLVSLQPEAFADVGLVVFDECHLLHPRDDDRSRRGLDSMLAILNLNQAAPGADFLLLSAMMKNTAEIAGWIAYLTGRRCLTLDLSWKPTRQVRGCVVYPAEQIERLKKTLEQARRDRPDQLKPPAAVARELNATPFGLFSLLQTWSTTNRADYALLRLIHEPQRLSTGKRQQGGWYLTPNGNETSSAIAARAVSAGLKSLVFVQTTVFCESCVRKFPNLVATKPIELTLEEAALRRLSVEEMGGAEYCYLKLNDDGLLENEAASHHALLLREERELHESLYRRPDGIKVLFATSTLAQGMNLPSEVVVISGDSRFDPDADRMKKLEAYELLNAAGRAGRAGEGAQGFVLLVPSKVIDFDDKNGVINGHWLELQSIFEQVDQCLVIEDPSEAILDRIHAGAIQSGMPAYLLSRLPMAVAMGEDPTGPFLRRTLAAYRAIQSGNEQWLQSRIDAATRARPTTALLPQDLWLQQVSGSTGLSVDLLQEFVSFLDAATYTTAAAFVQGFLQWLQARPEVLLEVVRPESLEGLFGGDYKKLSTDLDRARHALGALGVLWPLWLSGVPLSQLELALLGDEAELGHCQRARHFVSRVVPDLAFVAGLPARLLVSRMRAAGVEARLSTVIATLGGMVREGCDSPEALAVRLDAGRGVSRVAARGLYDALRALITAGSPVEDFEDTKQRVRDAKALWIFLED